MSQIAQQIVGTQAPGSLPSATVINPREHNDVSAIMTSGKKIRIPKKNQLKKTIS